MDHLDDTTIALIDGPAERPSKIDKAAALLGKHTARRRALSDEVLDGDPAEITNLNVADVMHGVTAGFLAQVFRMDPTTVKKKLRDCPPIHRRKSGWVYDFKVAAQYLVPPVFDVEQHLKTMRPSDLPTHLQEAYWAAMRNRQRWEQEAGHLWRTEQVMAVFGEVFQKIKFAIQLWPDNVQRAVGLSREQREMLIRMGDGLQAEIHKQLIDMPKEKQTKSSLIEGESKAPVPDDDYSHLI